MPRCLLWRLGYPKLINVLTDLSEQQPSLLETLDRFEPIIALVVFTGLAFFTRLYKIGLSPIVTWDEAQYVHGPSILADVVLSMEQFR
jgi:hypothetical protein